MCQRKCTELKISQAPPAMRNLSVVGRRQAVAGAVIECPRRHNTHLCQMRHHRGDPCG
jgi:hypothetical protein